VYGGVTDEFKKIVWYVKGRQQGRLGASDKVHKTAKKKAADKAANSKANIGELPTSRCRRFSWRRRFPAT
jgi:hypothetical protein